MFFESPGRRKLITLLFQKHFPKAPRLRIKLVPDGHE